MEMRRIGMGLKLSRVALLVSIAAVVTAGCTSGSSGPPRTGGEQTLPFTCPAPGQNVVVVAGDSLAAVWPNFASLPPGTVVHNVSSGGARFSASWTGKPQSSYSIAERALAQLDVCNDDVGLVIISGGVNDLAAGQDPQLAIDEAASLNQQLELRGVEVAWVPIVPWVIDPPLMTYDVRYDNRLTFNGWLAAPGSVSGAVLDCNNTLRQPNVGFEQLAVGYFSYLGLFQVDRFHPNLSGYAGYGACLGTLVSAELSGP